MGITAGIGHFFESILEVFQGIFAAILHAFQFVLQTFVDLGKGAVNFIEGTLGFAVHNFFILGTVAAAVFGYMLYAQRQGTTPVSRTVKNK
ncbi:uncharacterized protein PG998_005607 [Apiospora kogelbergensis]|uniref:Uncharacterized protein n=1 Tax=Apiospora kogelbergensis TaxID=1337665 RepID=A0AAW0R2Z5_9PEZI